MDAIVLCSKLLDRTPDLVYLAQSELCLVQEDEVFVKVIVIIKDVTLRLRVDITPRPSRFLNIILQRIRNLVVDNQTDIALVHSHPER